MQLQNYYIKGKKTEIHSTSTVQLLIAVSGVHYGNKNMFYLSQCKNSNHLNNEHLITRLYGCPVFKWLSHLTWRTL